MASRLIITIDGPAGVGKSTVAQMLAERLGIDFLDTGAMYRAVTYAALLRQADLDDPHQIQAVMKQTRFRFHAEGSVFHVSIDEEDVTEAIRDPEVTDQVRHIAAIPEARAELVRLQRRFAQDHPRIVTEGRDQGTVAFPDAEVKFFLAADPAERARRRKKQLGVKAANVSVEDIQNAIEQRDASDQNRRVGPLRPAGDAIHIDTTHLTARQVVDRMAHEVQLWTGRE